MPADVTLRPMSPQDGPALARLSAESPDTGQITFTSRYVVDACTALGALWEDSAVVVAEPEDAPGRLVGVGLVSFGRCQFEGDVFPYAILNSLKVHPQYRRQGIASRLASWRIEEARKQVGPEGILLANIQKGNEGSVANARKWARQITGQLITGVCRMRPAPPAPLPGVSVRAATPEDMAEAAAGMDQFYKGFNFYQPHPAESLTAWLSRSPFSTPFRHYVVATSAAGEILAGVALTEECRLRITEVGRLPGWMRLVNRFVGLVPADGILREIPTDRLWFLPGQLPAARHLWETLRYDWRERGTALMASYDPRGPLPAVYRLPAYMPRGTSTVAVSAPTPIREETLLCSLL